MKIYKQPLLWLISASLILLGCSGDPNAEANKLYSKASLILNDSKRTKDNYSEIFADYQQAKALIDEMLLDYPSSSTTVALMSETIKISDLTLTEFQRMEERLKSLSEAENHPLATAIVLARNIGIDSLYAKYLAEIAVNYKSLDDTEKAFELLQEAAQVAGKSEENFALRTVSVAFAKLGDFKRAIELLDSSNIPKATREGWLSDISAQYADKNRIEEAIELTSKISSRHSRVSSWIKIGSSLLTAGNTDLAINFFRTALKENEPLGTQWIADHNKQKIAIRYSESFKFNESIEIIQSIEDKPSRDITLREVAANLAKNGQFGKGIELYNRIESVYERALTLTKIADAHIDIGEKREAVKLLEQALKNAESISDSSYQSLVLSEIIKTLSRADELNLALEIVNKIKKYEHVDAALKNIVVEYSNVKQFEVAERIVASIDDRRQRMFAFASIANAYSDIGNNELAQTYLTKAFYNLKLIDSATTHQIEGLVYLSERYKEMNLELTDSDNLILREITSNVVPVKDLWE